MSDRDHTLPKCAQIPGESETSAKSSKELQEKADKSKVRSNFGNSRKKRWPYFAKMRTNIKRIRHKRRELQRIAGEKQKNQNWMQIFSPKLRPIFTGDAHWQPTECCLRPWDRGLYPDLHGLERSSRDLHGYWQGQTPRDGPTVGPRALALGCQCASPVKFGRQNI